MADLAGIGFASGLPLTGAPRGGIPTALLLFNFRVEAGQLAFVLVALAAHVGLVAPQTAFTHVVTSGAGPFDDRVVHFFVLPQDLIAVLALK